MHISLFQRAYWKKEFEKGKKELQQISKNVEYLVQNGITNEEVIDMYDSWAETYDEVSCSPHKNINSTRFQMVIGIV